GIAVIGLSSARFAHRVIEIPLKKLTPAGLLELIATVFPVGLLGLVFRVFRGPAVCVTRLRPGKEHGDAVRVLVGWPVERRLLDYTALPPQFLHQFVAGLLN